MPDQESQSVLEAFASLLAAADDSDRAALVARARLLAMNKADPSAFEAPIRTAGEYLDSEIEVPPVLVEPALVVRGGLLCTIGRAGKGKTQMNLNRIMRWATGEAPFAGLKTKDGLGILAPSHPLRTLIIENEGAAGMFHRQLGIMLNAPDYLTPEQRIMVRENVLIWGDGGWSGLKLDDEQQLNNVRAGVEKWKPDVVFIEPFRGLWRGEENSSTDMANVADSLSGIAADFDCGVVLTHHERKSGAGDEGEKMSSARGSSVLEGVVATMENFEVAKGGEYRELTWSKVRYGGGHPLLPVRMEWQPGDWWYKHVALDEIDQEILTELAGASPDPLTVADLKEATGENVHTIRRALNELVDALPPKIKRMPSAPGGGGARYRLITPDTESGEGVDF